MWNSRQRNEERGIFLLNYTIHLWHAKCVFLLPRAYLCSLVLITFILSWYESVGLIQGGYSQQFPPWSLTWFKKDPFCISDPNCSRPLSHTVHCALTTHFAQKWISKPYNSYTKPLLHILILPFLISLFEYYFISNNQWKDSKHCATQKLFTMKTRYRRDHVLSSLTKSKGNFRIKKVANSRSDREVWLSSWTRALSAWHHQFLCNMTS